MLLRAVKFKTPPSRAVKKIKVKFALEQAMKAQRGGRGIVLLFL
jgi:hypothetical protein